MHTGKKKKQKWNFKGCKHELNRESIYTWIKISCNMTVEYHLVYPLNFPCTAIADGKP